MATKRPMSAPKANDVAAAIPRIVLDDRGTSSNHSGGDPARPVSLVGRGTGVGATAGAANGPGTAAVPPSTATAAVLAQQPKESPDGFDGEGYIPHRCNSDIGLPTASMPNLTLAMTLGEDVGGRGGRGKLGVYCSPRTTRRSVDLDVSSSRDPAAREEYDWLLEERTASLHVLSAGSRVGSALSLNSMCTAHSVGLLSDSDDDFQDTSVNDSSVISEGGGGGGGLLPVTSSERAAAGTAQLRRLQSYPEEDHHEPSVGPSDVTPRTSHSLCNLQAAQQAPPVPHPEDRAQAEAQAAVPELTPEKLSLLPSDVDEGRRDHHHYRHRHGYPRGAGVGADVAGAGATAPPLPDDPSESERRDSRREGGDRQKADGEGGKKAPIVSYGPGAHAMREGRIRQWLEDMDKAS